MRILQFICHLDIGGAETLIKELSCEFVRQGHTVDLLLLDTFRESPHAVAGRALLEANGVRVYSLDRQPGKLPPSLFCDLVGRLRKEKYDVLHSHLPLPDLIATTASVFRPGATKLISTVHNSNLADDSRAWHLSARFRTNVFCSHSAAKANPNLGGRIATIPNGSTAAEPKPATSEESAELRTSLGIGPDETLLLNVGRVEAQKNQVCLVRAVAELRHRHGVSCHALIAGQSSPTSPDLDGLALELGVGDLIHLTGPRTDVPRLLQVANLFVSTSLWEGLPISVLEAMFSGIPCLLSNIREHLEIGEGVTQVSFADPQSPASFAEAIVVQLAARAPRHQILQLRHAELSRYSIESCANAYLQLYNQ
jgi:glycosyltransferase involved in cell wall biosynthesis